MLFSLTSFLLLATRVFPSQLPAPMTMIDPPAAPGALAPNLSQAGERVILSWLEPIGSSDRPVGFRLRSARFAGATWDAPTTIVESDSIFANWADFPSITGASDGTLLAHFAERSSSEPHAYDVQLGILDPRATAWRRIGRAHDDETPTEHGFVSVLPSAEKNAFRIFWLDGRELNPMLPTKGAMTLRTAVVRSNGVHETRVLDRRVCDCCGTAAVQTKEGSVVVYRDRTHDELRDISIVRQVGDRWSSPKRVHEDRWKLAGCPVNGPAADARETLLVVAWFTGEPRPLVRIAFSNDAGATFGASIRVDVEGTGEALGRVDVVLDGDQALVSWLSGENVSTASVLVRRVHQDGSVGPPVEALATSPARASGFPRMIRRDSDLLFAWTDVGPPKRVRTGAMALAAIPASSRESEVAAAQGARAHTRMNTNLAASAAGAVEYKARTLDGRAVALRGLRGQVVLLHLFATWCEPCRSEIPELNALHARYRDRGLAVVGVSMDEAGAAERIRRFVSEAGISYTVWHDPNEQASRLFAAPALPASVLLDRAGKIAWKRLGVLSGHDREFRRALENLLK